MINERVQLLVNALRSGEYPQTRSTLRDGRGFCCLGVACDVYHKATGKGEWAPPEKNPILSRCFLLDDSQETIALPKAVAEWFNAYDYGGWPIDMGPSLMKMNDDLQLDFSKIADAIETGSYFKETLNAE